MMLQMSPFHLSSVYLIISGNFVRIPDHIWQLLETLDDLGPPGLEADPILRHDQGKHGEGEHLAGVGLR